MNNYKISTPTGEIIVVAESQHDAVETYLEQSGMTGEFFKRHCTCKIRTFSDTLTYPGAGYLLYSDRRALEKAYTDWCDEHMVTEGHRDFGAFTFLHQKGWLNVRRIKSELGRVRSDDYFISPVRFREKMEDAFEETHGDPEAFHDAADNLMMKVLDQLGYGAGVAFFDEQEVWYA